MRYSASTLLNRLLARGKFRHVQLLLKLAELGSIQRSADAIGLSQSAATEALASLEALLEVPLFERHARGVRPTPACLDLLPMARQVLAGVSGGAEAVAARLNQGQGTVRLLTSAAALHGLLLGELQRFATEAPHIQVQLSEAEGEDLMLPIARGETDLVACRRRAVVPEGWRFEPLLQDRLAVVCASSHPLARSRRPGWAALARSTWLLAPAGSLARERFDELARHFPSDSIAHPVVSRSPAMFRWLLQQQAALAVLPITMVSRLVETGELAELKIGEPMPLEPIGLLLPTEPTREAPAELARFLLRNAGR